jgi:hypothetical protein
LFFGTDDTPKGSITFPIVGDGNFRDYDIDLRSHAEWKGRVGYLRLDPTSEASGSFAIDYLRFYGNPHELSYSFASAEGWSTRDLGMVSYPGEVFTGEASGNAPTLQSPDLNLDANRSHHLRIRMKTSGSPTNTAAIRFTTAQAASFDSLKSVSFTPSGGRYHDGLPHQYGR